MKRNCILFALIVAALPGLRAGSGYRLRPPLRVDADDRPIPQPRKRQVSELYAIVYNSWLRHMNPEYKAECASDPGALNVSAWDEVPDSSWFRNRTGGARTLGFEEILAGIEGEPPRAGTWNIIRINDEGYTPKLDITDAVGRKYVLKFDLKSAPERNSGAERICTLIMHAAGYNVPHNSIVCFRREDLQLGPDSYYRDAANKRRKLTPADLDAMIAKLAPMRDGRYRGLASMYIAGKDVGRFVYTGKRGDDANDLIPHEMRRELRGMRVIASWINHVDVGDKNALDVYVSATGGGGFVRHYMLDFGSAMGSGDFINGPFRVGHEYIFDGPSIGKSLVTLGAWRRPWDASGKILYTEVGYFPVGLFDPAKWRPNYPNLAFERMDAGDAYWGAKIVTAFSDGVIERLAEAGAYSRPEVTKYVADAFKRRRDRIGNYWLNGITALEDFKLEQADRRYRLLMRDLAAERGYSAADSRTCRYSVEDSGGRKLLPETVSAPGAQALDLGSLAVESPSSAGARPDRYGRIAAARILVQTRCDAAKWALPVEVVIGYQGRNSPLEVLGWAHAPGHDRNVPGNGARPETQPLD